MPGFNNGVCFAENGFDFTGADGSTVTNALGGSNSGITNTITCQNTSNTANSQASFKATVGGASSGDVWHQYSIGSAQSYSIGIDNSDSDRFKITSAQSDLINPSSGTVLQQFVSVATAPAVQFPIVEGSLGGSFSGANANFNIFNLNTTAASDASLSLQVSAAGSGGNSFVSYTGPTNNWFHGCNKTGASQAWQLQTAVASLFPSANVVISATPEGEVTFPLTPSFSAYLASDDLNVTGNGASYTLGTNVALTEIFDQNSDFNTNGTFTAPVTGKYEFVIYLRFASITAAMTFSQNTLITSNRSYLFQGSNIAAERTVAVSADRFQINATAYADMDAGDTATVSVQISGGAGNTAGLVSAGGIVVTGFAGFLHC